MQNKKKTLKNKIMKIKWLVLKINKNGVLKY